MSRQLSKEAFLSLAQAVGLDLRDPHLEELWPVVQGLWASLARLDELDLGAGEPATLFLPVRE